MKKTVKAWAIVQKAKKGGIENAAYFDYSECPATEPTMAMAIYFTRKDAMEMLIPDEHKIVPCTITLPY